MKLFSFLSPSNLDLPPALRVGILLSCLPTLANAINFKSIPAANLDLNSKNLGRVGLAGDFNGISLYQFEGQNENGFNTNGSQSVLTRFPNGGFANLAMADGGIQTMCSFVMHSGTMAGVIVGGNFTSLGGIQSPGAALFNPNTSTITPLAGLSGQVSALLCDQDTNTVYVGGSFRGANSTNAIAWVGTTGWTNLPFDGFNGPVTSITKASNGHIIFGGSFTGLGNTTGPSLPDQQIINISGANITSGSSASTAGFSDPTNIVCKTGGVDGSGNTWLLADNTPGFWKANFGFGFEPTKLRLWNTHQDGRGTQTWRFTALPINGIMNFTYIDPATGRNASCSSECPLSSNSSVKFQDFHFVNVIGMNAFQVDISAWYGSGGGLNGIELFENDIFSYAINTFNEPTCASIGTASTATQTGPWSISPSFQSMSEYLTATIDATNSNSASVVFLPDVKQSGNYSVNIYTPGCIQDNSCSSRGRVNITGVMGVGTNQAGFTTEIFQTNNFDKYDQIYFGYVDASSTAFRPSVTLMPASGQNTQNLTVVAQRVGFSLISSAGGLNSIFEYDPTQAVINTANFATSVFDQAGSSLQTGAGVTSLQTSGSTTFVGGNFSTSNFSNVFEITSTGATSLAGKGLNGEVKSMFLNGTLLYVGGRFSNTSNGGSIGLNNVAAYDTSKNAWNALGAGVNGPVNSVVPISMNITSNKPEITITLTGNFNQILGFGSNASISVTGFAVWVPSHNNWLQNIHSGAMGINGALTATVDIPGGGAIFSGSLTSSQVGTSDVAELSSSGALSSFPIQIRPTSTQASGAFTKRASSNQNVTGVVTGLFYENGGRNVTILGGHFTATASNGSDISNLVFINGSNSDSVTGVGPSLSIDSTILAMALQGDLLYAGGVILGTVNGGAVKGLITYDLIKSTFPSQPPSLNGNVNAITTRQSTGDVFVGGSFSSAGSLSCPAVCIFATSASQWDRPGSTLGGTAHAMTWASTSALIVGGALTLGGENVSVAEYDTKAQNWTAFPDQSSIPGPVSVLAPANSDSSQLWVSGIATNGSTFLMKFNGTAWTPVGSSLGKGTNIRGLQVLGLTKNHASSSFVDDDKTLMITGALNLPGFGTASAALFNGTTFTPFALTTTAGNTGGSLSQFFSQRQNVFQAAGGHLAKGYVVLIALGIALALIMIIVVAGLYADRWRRKREGYIPAPSASYDRGNGLSRIPPNQLFGSLPQGRKGVEKQATMI